LGYRDGDRSGRGADAPRVLLSLAVAVNIGALPYFKYTDFLLEHLNAAPKAVLLGDSFADALAPILSDAFSRLHYHRLSHGGPDPSMVAQEAPDVVILLSVERYLPRLANR
jgi:hypothetical protein